MNYIGYIYDGNGVKRAKSINGGQQHTYVDGIEGNGTDVVLIHTDEGVAQNNGGVFTYQYNLSDHLGNVRYTFNIYGGVKRRLQSDDYYAFGKRKSSGSPVSLNNKYLYNGKEMQDELASAGEDGQLDYGARFYDPVIGRWNVVDPMVDGREWLSGYNYVQNNPILRIDPTGAFDWVMDANKMGKFMNG